MSAAEVAAAMRAVSADRHRSRELLASLYAESDDIQIYAAVLAAGAFAVPPDAVHA